MISPLGGWAAAVALAGARSGPCALRAPDVRLRLVVPVSACDRSGPADIGHIADLVIRDMNVEEHDTVAQQASHGPGWPARPEYSVHVDG
jgi:hypothetical protein